MTRRDSFITHRAFCDALAQESARLPPPLYGSINNRRSLGFSSQVSSHHQISSTQNDNQPTSSTPHALVGLGGSTSRAAAQFDNLITPNIGSSFRPPLSPSASSAAAFFVPDPNQDHHQNINQSHHHHGLLMHHPHHPHHPHSDLQSNTNLNCFFSNTSSGIVDNPNNVVDNSSFLLQNQFNVIGGHSGGGGSEEGNHQFHQIMTSAVPSVYSSSSSVQNNNNVNVLNNPPHLSATALLQKAAQMGSTSSSSSTGIKPSERVGGIFGNSNGNHLRDLMNSLASRDQFNENNYGGYSNVNINRQYVEQQPKLAHNLLSVSVGGGSDRLTRDFLGVGEIVRSLSAGGGFSQREQQGGIDTSSLDSERSAPQSQSFGDHGNFQ